MRKLLMILMIGMFLIVSVSACGEIIAQDKPVKLIFQGNATTLNISVEYVNQSGFWIDNKAMTKSGFTFYYDFYNTSETGILRYFACDGLGDCDYSCDKEITPTGENFDNSQGLLVIAFIGLVALFMAIAFGFSKEKWKLRTAFFIFALLMGVITLNSLRVMAKSSSTLTSMANSGLILGIIVVSFMILYILIYYTIEVFQYFKDRSKMRWEVKGQ